MPGFGAPGSPRNGNPGFGRQPGAPAGSSGFGGSGPSEPLGSSGSTGKTSGKMQKIIFADYSFELPGRFVPGPKAPPPPAGFKVKTESWLSRSEQGDVNEVWSITLGEDPRLLPRDNFEPKKALEDFTKGFLSKQPDWKLLEVSEPKTRGLSNQPIHVTRTLVQMPLGEIVGYSAILKGQDHVIYVMCFQYNGDVLNQIIELEKCLDTIKRN